MPSYEQTPGTLNLAFNRANDFSTLVDFSIAMTGHTVESAMTSLVTGDVVQPFGVNVVDAPLGKVNLSLTDAQTGTLDAGTYGWFLKWTEGGVTRTALTGFVEVLP